MRSARRPLWPVLAAVGVAAEAVGFGFDDPGAWVPDLLTGWVLGACGLVAWERRPRSLVGPLLVATGGLWFVGDVSAAAVYAYRGPLLHLTLTYPGGRPRGRAQALTVAAAYLAAVIAPVWRSEPLTIVLSLAFVAAAAGHRRGTAGRERRERTYALRATAAVAVPAGGDRGRSPRRPHADGDRRLAAWSSRRRSRCSRSRSCAALLREPWARTGATDLVVELAETRSGTLRDRLARALGDPTLEVGFRAAEGDGYVDAAGRPLTLPPPGSPRRTTVVERDERAPAVLVHDPALLDDPGLAAALAEAAQSRRVERAPAGRGARADRRASGVAAPAARGRRRRAAPPRAAAAGDRRAAADEAAARARAARASSRDGDPQRAARVQRVSEQLEHSLADVRRLAAGLHPRELATGGLDRRARGAGRALAGARRARVGLPEQLSAEAERAAYFVCSEGLANVAKYADASRARVTVAPVAARLRVEVADDGRGGADPGGGTGLRGLADRVEALGGALTVDSRPGAGTRLVAELPLTGPS